MTVTTHESWFSRLGNSIKSVLAGVLLFIISFPLLWWNEGRAVKTAKALAELGGNVKTVSADKVDPAMEGKPVHMIAAATVDEVLADGQFPVSAKAVKLRRTVEMYQWTEKQESKTKKNVGGSQDTETTYRYEMGWDEDLHDSSDFKVPAGHENPKSKRFENVSKTAERVGFGAFTLSKGLLDDMNAYAPLPFGEDLVAELPDGDRQRGVVQGEWLYLPNDPVSYKPNPAKPRLGDLRIKFEAVEPADVSVIAQQHGSSFGPWQSSVEGSSPIERLSMGRVDAKAMVGAMESENTTLTWILRGVGFLAMAFGIGMVFGPMAVLADVLPILGTIARSGISLFAGVLAASLTLVTIAAAWLYYRPVLAVGLIVVAVAIVFVARMLLRKRAPAAVATE
jgi:hypothetical protein